jgi:hypothetical protein
MKLHHGGDKRHVAREPVQFGNDKPGLVLSARRQGLRQFRPVVAAASLVGESRSAFGELRKCTPGAAPAESNAIDPEPT